METTGWHSKGKLKRMSLAKIKLFHRLKSSTSNNGASPLERKRARMRLLKRGLWILLAALVLLWAALPAVRAVSMLANFFHRSSPAAPNDLPVQTISFRATDGVQLAGWFVMVAPAAPTIILVHGSKGSRTDMLPWARFLSAAGYNILLYDSRGCGASEGWGITAGVREPDDVLGAVRYLQQRADLRSKRFGALGISLGAGTVLLAAAREPALLAVVADSAWADTSFQIARMSSLSTPLFPLPLLPYEPALIHLLVGGNLAAASPLAVIGQISPRAVLLIHSADDQNATTPLSGERRLFAAAGQPKQEWIAPNGGHVGALAAHTAEYEQRVLAFFARYLG
jgi:dipeptidyl aminopeptidase/acylaminoacyl peptidase